MPGPPSPRFLRDRLAREGRLGAWVRVLLTYASSVTKPLKRLLMLRNIILAHDFAAGIPFPKGSLRLGKRFLLL